MAYNLIRTSIIYLVFGFFISLNSPAFSQQQIQLPESYSNLTWNDFVVKMEQDFSLRFFYLPEDIPKLLISFDSDSISLMQLLNDHFNPHNIFVSIDRTGNVFLIKDIALQTSLPEDFFQYLIPEEEEEGSVAGISRDFLKTTERYIAKTITVGSRKKGVNKSTATISGYATNAKTGEVVISATIFDKSSGKGTVTDVNGFFSMTLNKGEHILTVSSVNIKEEHIKVDLLSDGELNLVLEDKIVLLSDVVIKADINNKVIGTQMGLEKITAKSIKKIPLVFGEKDIFKVALLLPGVQSLGEGSSGFNVRGSPTDQNVFYINHVPIYNTSHVAGFFSAFNSDAIDEFSLFKSNIPVHYGGRISSVFEIKSKQGSNEKYTASGGISPITGRFIVEGPLKKEKSSFLIGVRSTYSDWILNFVKDPEIKNSKARFADIVTNFSLQLKNNNQLNVFSYFSYDKMDLASQTKYDYQNLGGSVVWKHYFRMKNSFEISLAHSRYQFSEENSQFEIASYIHSNQLDHTEIKAISYIRPNEKHTINFGVNSILYQINRGQYDPLTQESLIETTDMGNEKGIETGFFVGDEWKVLPQMTIEGGIRYNLFTYLGAQEVFEYEEGFPKKPESIVDTLYFDNFEAVKTYGGLDVRLAANYMVSDRLSLKIAYNRLHQYIYMLTNTIAISPNYKWKLCDYNTEPIIGEQFSLGMFTNILNGRMVFSLETYYKKSQNVVEVKDGADLFLNEHVERSTLQGDLDAYGFEIMLQKPFGDLNGWVNYTYSHSSVLVNSIFKENQINFGEPYPSNFDKPHAFNFVASYAFSRRVSISGNVVYSTGRPITYPTSVYYQNDIPTLNYSSRNAYRIPDYFRVDMALSIEGSLLKRKPGHGSWTFSVYNILGRNNVYSVYFIQEDDTIKAYKLSIFGVPIFSISYNIKLGNYASE